MRIRNLLPGLTYAEPVTGWVWPVVAVAVAGWLVVDRGARPLARARLLTLAAALLRAVVEPAAAIALLAWTVSCPGLTGPAAQLGCATIHPAFVTLVLDVPTLLLLGLAWAAALEPSTASWAATLPPKRPPRAPATPHLD